MRKIRETGFINPDSIKYKIKRCTYLSIGVLMEFIFLSVFVSVCFAGTCVGIHIHFKLSHLNSQYESLPQLSPECADHLGQSIKLKRVGGVYCAM